MKITGVKIQVFCPSVSRFCAVFIRKPQLVNGSCMPMPRKLRKASANMICGIISVKTTITWLNVLGYKCLKIIRKSLAPCSLAARMKSVSRSESTLPRTSRASTAQRKKGNMKTIIKKRCSPDQVFGITATSAIHSGSSGKDMITSTKRCITLSMAPP